MDRAGRDRPLTGLVRVGRCRCKCSRQVQVCLQKMWKGPKGRAPRLGSRRARRLQSWLPPGQGFLFFSDRSETRGACETPADPWRDPRLHQTTANQGQSQGAPSGHSPPRMRDSRHTTGKAPAWRITSAANHDAHGARPNVNFKHVRSLSSTTTSSSTRIDGLDTTRRDASARLWSGRIVPSIAMDLTWPSIAPQLCLALPTLGRSN